MRDLFPDLEVGGRAILFQTSSRFMSCPPHEVVAGDGAPGGMELGKERARTTAVAGGQRHQPLEEERVGECEPPRIIRTASPSRRQEQTTGSGEGRASNRRTARL